MAKKARTKRPAAPQPVARIGTREIICTQTVKIPSLKFADRSDVEELFVDGEDDLMALGKCGGLTLVCRISEAAPLAQFILDRIEEHKKK